jgi:hypothetical protein
MKKKRYKKLNKQYIAELQEQGQELILIVEALAYRNDQLDEAHNSIRLLKIVAGIEIDNEIEA